MRTVENIDNIIKTFYTDEEFLEYAKIIYKENEDGNPYPSEIHWLPDSIKNALEYIEEYCPDLILKEWVCTDPDNDQYGRQISKTIFEFVEYGCKKDEDYQLVIDLDNYTTEKIEEYVYSYYPSLDKLKETCGDGSNWIIAECIFEQESGNY